MDDVFDLAGQSLTILALWLDKVSPVPWPLFIGFLFLPLVVWLRWSLWFLRGGTWPVYCKYFHTQQARSDKPCRVIVAGEWRYCRHHNRPKKMADGHLCDPGIPRWQSRIRGRVIERDDIRGVGFVSLLSNRETLLFYKGIARRPGDVWRGVPALPSRFSDGLRLIRDMSWRDVMLGSGSSPSGVTERMPRVVTATRWTLSAFAAALLLVVITVFFPDGPWRRSFQYLSTASFFLAWSAVQLGIWKKPEDEPRWKWAAIRNTLKAVGMLVVVALISLLVSKVGKRVEEPPPAGGGKPSPSVSVSHRAPSPSPKR